MESTRSAIHAEQNHKKETLVEIFKTNVNDERLAVEIITALKKLFPNYEINFDLDDCDRILRIESDCGYVEVDEIKNVVRSFNCNIEILP